MNKEEEKYLNKMQPKPIGNWYFWIVTVVNGKNVIAKCCNSNEDAESFAYDHNFENYKVFKLKTHSIQAASQQIRGKRLESGVPIEKVMQRFKRKL